MDQVTPHPAATPVAFVQISSTQGENEIVIQTRIEDPDPRFEFKDWEVFRFDCDNKGDALAQAEAWAWDFARGLAGDDGTIQVWRLLAQPSRRDTSQIPLMALLYATAKSIPISGSRGPLTELTLTITQSEAAYTARRAAFCDAMSAAARALE